MKRLHLLSAATVSFAIVAVVACGNDSPTNTTPGGGSGNTAGAGVTAGTGGSAAGSTGTAGSGTTAGSAGTGTTAGAGGTGTAGGTGGGGAGGGAGGGVACKPVTQLNGSGIAVAAMDISAFKYVAPPTTHLTKVAYDPMGKLVVAINGDDGKMFSFDPSAALPATAMTSPVTTSKPYNVGYTVPQGYGTGIYQPYRGLAFGPDGTLYVMAAKAGGVAISKGAPAATPDGTRTWTTLVSTSMPFTPSGTNYDHSFSGIAVSADGMSLYFSSGSRTEHGEQEGGDREVALSSAIFKVPTNTPTDLKNDETALKPFLFADGTRNTFDLAFNAAGDLFGTENGPDLDLSDEVNFLEQGKHYGFPWRFSNVDNPTRDQNFDYTKDKRARPAVYADISQRYKADGAFPAPPAGVTFTDPVVNMGPDGNYVVPDANSAAMKAGATGMPGVSAHRSPLGLSFDTAGALCGQYYKAGFMLSYGPIPGGSIGDAGEDLLLVTTTKGADGKYTMTLKTLVAQGIHHAMDSVLVGNRLFTIGQDEAAQVYVFVLPTP
jgi:hypothetical protein